MTIEEIVQTQEWKDFIKRLEKISFILIGISIIMLLTGIRPFRSIILTLALSSLSIVSYFMAFNKFNSESKFLSVIFNKIYGFGLAMSFVSIMFYLMHWPGARMMGLLGYPLILIALYLSYKESKGLNTNKIGWRYYARLFLAIIPLSYFLFLA